MQVEYRTFSISGQPLLYSKILEWDGIMLALRTGNFVFALSIRRGTRYIGKHYLAP